MKKAGLEFHVTDERGQGTTIFTNFDKAAGFALSRACSTGNEMQIDVVTWSRAAARAWSGDTTKKIQTRQSTNESSSRPNPLVALPESSTRSY